MRMWFSVVPSRPMSYERREYTPPFPHTMRYATFALASDPTPRLGAVHGDRILDVAAALSRRGAASAPGSMLELIEQGPDVWQRVRDALAGGDHADASHAVADVVWHV